MGSWQSRRFWMAVYGGALAILLAQNAAASVGVIRAKDLVDGLGVNTHIPYQWSGYWDANKTAADLKFLGIKNARDLQLGISSTEQNRFGTVADAGNRFDFIFEYTIPDGIARVESFATAHPGSALAIEGPNEISNQPITYNGLTGQAGGAAYQGALYGAVKTSAVLSATPVYSLSDSRADPAKLDFANSHPYARYGAQPFATLQKSYNSWSGIYPGKPVVFTETGYHTQLGGAGGVDVATQATLTLNSVLDAFWLGVAKVFLYEMLDEGSSAKVGSQWHFGLFYSDHTPKPAATALANFVTLINDATVARRASPLPNFPYTAANLPSTAKVLRIAKDDGTQILAVWNEPVIWNAKTEQPIAITPTTVTVNFDSAVGPVTIYDPVAGAQPLSGTMTGARSVAIQLADHPLLIVIASR